MGPATRQVPHRRRVPDLRVEPRGVLDGETGVQSGVAATTGAARATRRADSRLHRPPGPPERRGFDFEQRRLLRAQRRAGCVSWVGAGRFAGPAHGHAGKTQGQSPSLDRVQQPVRAQAHRGGGYSDDAFAVRTVRVEPALRDALRHRAGGARSRGVAGHCTALRRHERRHGVEVRTRGGGQVPLGARASREHVLQSPGRVRRRRRAGYATRFRVGPRRVRVRTEAD
mmetsp:Transcript_9582/g.35598  ORF Transcript_9582/g.35598 Transcript_9582/m.35598 type:complete len:227 (-) Transcript_9582:560-1240(-)